MPYAGLDVHKRVVEAAVLRDDGELLWRAQVACTRTALTRLARDRLGPHCHVALEATTNTWAVAALLEPYVAEVVVSNPLRTRLIAEAKVKTDRVDALVLAQLLRADFLPRVWQPDEQTRRLRDLTARRASLTHDRTRIKNRIHAVLHQRLLAPPCKELFSQKGLAWLKALRVDPSGRAAIDSELRLLAQVDAEVATMDQTMADVGWADERVKLLMTLPGVNMAVAEGLLGALGDINRFRDGDHAASYLGIVPSTRQSAEHCYHGPITKQGRGHTRWLLVQAAQCLASNPGPLGVFFRRLAKKKNRNVAVVATARKLVTIAWQMLKNNEPYRYAQPDPTETKLQRMRGRATGERRAGGMPKGPRPATYGTKTRLVPPIDEVLRRHGLPEVAPLPLGELRMLRENKLLPFLEDIQTTKRVPRRKCAEPNPPPAKRALGR
jgi:transposase